MRAAALAIALVTPACAGARPPAPVPAQPSSTSASRAAASPECRIGGKLPHELVDPYIGVRDSVSNSVLGPQVPFGSINPSPDSPQGSHDGYAPGQPIRGFSQLHATGTGWGKYGQILISPQTGLAVAERDHESPASDEVARAGYYAVTLARYGIRTEIAPAHYSAIYRFTFARSDDATIAIDVSHSIPIDIAPEIGGVVHSGGVDIDGNDPAHVTGESTHEGGFGAGRYTVYFALRFDRAPASFGTWRGADVHEHGRSESLRAKNERVGAFVRFRAADARVVRLKIGVSLVSVARAEELVAREIPGWDFDAVRGAAENAWDRALGRVCVEGGAPDDRTLFYTALYRSMLMPRDRTLDRPEGSAATAYWDDHYAGWDTWRTLFPLNALVNPDMVAANVQSFIDRYRRYGVVADTFIAGQDGLPEQGGNDADNVIADAIARRVPGFDREAAYAVMKHDAERERRGLVGWGGDEHPDEYRARGWISEGARMSSSYTLEYAYNDFVAAEVAQSLGKTEDAKTYAKRSTSWQNLWNPALTSDGFSGFIDVRRPDGSFASFDPKRYSGSWHEAFYEGTSWTYSYFVPHDFAKLIELMGGREKFVERLEHGTQGLIDYGNEPGFLALRAFVYALRPDLSSKAVRDLMLRSFTSSGYPGNDDSGAMPSWYVFGALGLFPNAGQPIWLLNGPLFPRATLVLPATGTRLVIEASDAARDHPYIQSCEIDGKPLDRAWLTHAELVGAHTLHFTMGAAPSRFGTTGKPPPSLSTDGLPAL